MSKHVLHVVNISFVIPYFFGNQFRYLAEKSGNQYFVACSPSSNKEEYAKLYQYTPLDLKVLRSINPVIDCIAILKLCILIKKHKIDTIVGHTPKGGMIAMIAGYLTRVPERIYFRHGIVYETSTGAKRKMLKFVERISGKLAKKVVCVSDAVKDFSEKDHLNQSAKNIVLGLGSCNGVDTAGKFNPELIEQEDLANIRKKYGILENDFVVGFVGRLVNDKGIPELIAAWQEIIKVEQNIKLMLVGPFETRDPISTDVRTIIENTPSIMHIDLVENTAPYLACMDILALPTYREGFPTVVLEASSMRLPVLITKATGCEASIVDGETGTFITHDSKNIGKTVLFYKNHPNECTRQGINGRIFVEMNFNHKIIWDLINTKLHY